ncbi:MarR family winged helix-turn-helix transcriptional regulator [Nocardia sp. NBC_01730]|uniref:MarR family winged helix-turn-helix transcriptional regulator n=1 Tax=Nocardia sp. NBC_01730 TaxID=2975998 RepID=UPI002E159677|nr:MarR family winged helix-turn-helix transcriptional regulator [Nocardia sp. NBC_01730]
MANEQEAGRAAESPGRDLVTQIIDTLPDWVTQLIRLNGLIAERIGLVPSDFHCLHALHRNGPTTAGALAARVGLSPGSTTRMIDRLTEAGCVERVPDPHDRRRILVHPTAEGLARVAAYYDGLTARTRSDLTAFDGEELQALLRFIEASRDSATTEVDRLRTTRSDP